MTRHARIEIVPSPVVYIDEDGNEWPQLTPATTPHFLRLVASNGAILAHSENYATRSNARRGAAAMLDAIEEIASLAWGGEEWAREVEP